MKNKNIGSPLSYGKKYKYLVLHWNQGFCTDWFLCSLKDVKERLKHCSGDAYEIKRKIIIK